jgi:transcription termination/antitermination protein NusA
MAISANRLELLQIADAVAREKQIDRETVIQSMEDAYERAARSRYGSETLVRAEINRRTGEIRLSRLLNIVEQVDNDATDISLKDALRKDSASKIGDQIAETLPPMEFGRIAAQASKQVQGSRRRDPQRRRQAR